MCVGYHQTAGAVELEVAGGLTRLAGARLIPLARSANITLPPLGNHTMNPTFTTPQDAEDAYYDALEEANLPKLLAVWDDSDDISCLLPMQALAQGRAAVTETFAQLLSGGRGIELSVTHLHWIETPEVAIHLVEETAQKGAPGGPPPMPVYASNIYRKGNRGWHLIVHQNAPTPPPPGMLPPGGA